MHLDADEEIGSVEAVHQGPSLGNKTNSVSPRR